MNSSKKAVLVGVLAAFVIGFLAGFIPEHTANSTLQKKIEMLSERNSGLQGQLNRTQNQLTLSSFAARSAAVLVDADRNNYSAASTNASSLFTDMRRYVDESGDTPAKVQLSQVLTVRDRTIAALAKADPAAKQLLLQIFLKAQDVSAQAMQGR